MLERSDALSLIEAMELMDLKPGFSQSELHSRWRELARIYHPDQNRSPEARMCFIKVQQAYLLLNARFFGDSRGENQDCLDRLSREASDHQCHENEQTNKTADRKPLVQFWFAGPSRLNYFFIKIGLIFIMLLAVAALACKSARICQGLYELQIEIAFTGSVLGAFVAGLIGIFKTRVLVR